MIKRPLNHLQQKKYICSLSGTLTSLCLVLRNVRSGRSQQPPSQSWVQDPDRPSIISATELKELDNLDTDGDEGWAGAQMEVDYTEKLNFSDDEENQSTKDKVDNWEWVSKVDHMRSCVPENQEAWKEGSEEHGSSKTAWADSVDSRMASTGIVTQYNKSLASKVYQVTLVRTTPNYLYASIVWKRL
ncbi:protein PRRC2C [Oryzias melastigma]|uniref:protein PRRC2C n=1 Tax=Oryzias melastigma TaxID=30732 RepID=UPI000CF7EE47|nr:protein PRRC2C [Oryzias melastigma]